MKTGEYAGEPFTAPRSHPWTHATTNTAFRYRDLRAEPALVRTALEDFVPWSQYAAIDAFYALVEWLNADGGELETSDCAFTGPHANEAPAIAAALQCEGRVIVLFRELARNLSRPRIDAFKNTLHYRLGPLDAEFAWGQIGTTLLPTRYLALPGTDAQQLGYQLMISFWAWGDDEPDLMANLARVVANLARALRGPIRKSA